jgi:GT2 family glycosyltransferase
MSNIVLAIPNRSASSQINAQLANFIHKVDEENMPDSGDYDLKVSFNYLQPVDANRNKMVKDFLENEDNEWMLMVDNDVVPPGDILKMVDHGKKVVSGVVTIKKDGVPHPVITRKTDEGKFRRISLQEYQDEVDEEGLIEVDGAGTGCLLVHRSIFEEMSPPWFKFMYNEDGTLKLGEDFYFSQRLEEMGQPTYVSSEFVCSHYRKTDLTEFAQIVAEAENVNPES